MGKNCCVIGCRSTDSDTNIHFYKFPEEKKLRKRWIEAIENKEKDWQPDKNTLICSAHFVTGSKNENSWHPDYVPSVFRTLRREKKPIKRRFGDSDDESTPIAKKKVADVLKHKKTSLASSTRNTPKVKISSISSIGSKRRTKIESVGIKELNKELSVVLGGSTASNLSSISSFGDKDAVVIAKQKTPTKFKEALEAVVKGDLQETESSDTDYEDEKKENEEKGSVKKKTKDLSDESPIRVYSPASPSTPMLLKNLSVVLERTSSKEIKLSTGRLNLKTGVVKEEETDDSDSQTKYLYPSPTGCKKCSSLQMKIKKLQKEKKSGGSKLIGGKCSKCNIVLAKCQKLENELDNMLESRVNKCLKCSSLESKCKRVENNLKKANNEVTNLQNKLGAIEINEDTFKKYKSKVKMYTGLPNFETLMLLFDHVKPNLPKVAIKSLSQFQMFILVLMRAKLNLPFWDLTYRFGTTPNLIQAFYPQYLSTLESQLSHVVLWPKANLHYRLQVLAGNLKQSFGIIQEKVEVKTLLGTEDGVMTEDERIIRLCAALYHIAQLVTSNHSQQLTRILKSKNETNRKQFIEGAKKSEEESEPQSNEKTSMVNGEAEGEPKEKSMNGDNVTGDVDDSDILYEDLTNNALGNSNDTLELECKNLKSEIEQLAQKVTIQFKFYTGLRSKEAFANLLVYLEPYATHISQEKLTHFQQLHMVITRLKLNLEVQDLAYMFSIDVDYVVYLTKQWVDVLAQRLKDYIDWTPGADDSYAEKRLLGTVKLKYQILWGPILCSRNKQTGREKEKIDLSKLLYACAGLYNIEDIESINKKMDEKDEKTEEKTNESLEKECRSLREQLYELRKCNMHSICTCFKQENFQDSDAMIRFYTGFPTYESLYSLFEMIVPSHSKESRMRVLAPFEQFIIILMRLKLNLSTFDLGLRFGTGQTNIHRLCTDWLMILHTHLAPHITWPDDDEDAEVFTDMLRKTFVYLSVSLAPRRKEHDRNGKADIAMFDIATLVCAGLYNVGEITYEDRTDSEFDSFDEDW